MKLGTFINTERRNYPRDRTQRFGGRNLISKALTQICSADYCSPGRSP